MTILTPPHAQPKASKGIPLGHSTATLMLAHADTSGEMNVCPHSTPGCRAACIGEQGRGPMSRPARIDRTLMLKDAPAFFLAAVARDIERHVAKSHAEGLTPSVRLNGTSDVLWENLRDREGLTLLERFPNVQFYDYTAYSLFARRVPSNYHLTFSRKETTPRDVVLAHLRAGFQVAVPFAVRKDEPLPTRYLRHRVVDGDEHDLLFLHPPGAVIGLRAKGTSHRDKSGFIVAN